MLQKGALVKLSPIEGGFYSKIFLVPKKDGNMRPVINLKALNQFVVTRHFKMEGMHTLLQPTILCDPNSQAFLNRRSPLSVHLPSLRPVQRTWAFTKILKPATEQG